MIYFCHRLSKISIGMVGGVISTPWLKPLRALHLEPIRALCTNAARYWKLKAGRKNLHGQYSLDLCRGHFYVVVYDETTHT